MAIPGRGAAGMVARRWSRNASKATALGVAAVLSTLLLTPVAGADGPDPIVGSWTLATIGVVYTVRQDAPDHFSVLLTADSKGAFTNQGLERECPPVGATLGTLTGPGPTYVGHSYLFSTQGDRCVNEGPDASPETLTLTNAAGVATLHICLPPEANGPPGSSGPTCFDLQRVESSETTAPSPPSSAPTSTPAHTTGPPLCPEALALLDGFGRQRLAAAGITDPNAPTTLTVDGSALLAQFRGAIDSYDQANPDNTSYATDGTPVAGELGALGWLFTERGLLDTSSSFVTHQEVSLRLAIIDESNRRASAGGDPHLSPGDVLGLALKLSHGDVNSAILTAHNTLRSLARGKEGDITGVYGDQAFFTSRLAPLRSGDNAGVWYHLFGTAYMEMVVKGDWGPWLATAGANAAVIAGLSTGLLTGGTGLMLMGGIYLAHKYQSAGDASAASGASRLFNDLEQAYREGRAGPFSTEHPNKPDPEKFCINVWGAQIGRQLYESLPHAGGVLHQLFSAFTRPTQDDTETTPSLDSARMVVTMNSPFSVELRDGSARLVLDQDSDPSQAGLYGGVPGMLLPVDEGSSWGALWVVPAGHTETATFAATSAGAHLHVSRLDVATGQVAVYEATATHEGQQFTANLDNSTVLPVLRRDDGMVVRPDIVTISAGSHRARVWGWVLVGLGLLLAAAGALAVFGRAARKARSPEGLATPSRQTP